MKESVSMTTIFQIVILFILLFAAIMIFTLNNSNAFAVKNDIINIINFRHGEYLDPSNKERLIPEIVDSIKYNSYRSTGKCNKEDGFKGYRKDGMATKSNEKASICIKEVSVSSERDNYLDGQIPEGNGTYGAGDFFPDKYYIVMVFYQLDLPVINQIFNMKTTGETKIMYSVRR